MVGASQYGTSGESLVVLTVVTGTGEVIRTGAPRAGRIERLLSGRSMGKVVVDLRA